jgi:hypothetical protein
VQNGDGRWAPSREFLATKLGVTQTEMGTAILNRSRWDKLREESRLLVFLNRRADAPDFQGVREELNRIAEGRMRVPELSTPRTQATDCLRLWQTALLSLDQPVPAAPAGEPAVALSTGHTEL